MTMFIFSWSENTRNIHEVKKKSKKLKEASMLLTVIFLFTALILLYIAPGWILTR